MTQADWVKELEVDLEERLSHITFNMEKYKLNNYGHELPARPALDFMMKDLVKKYVDLAQQRTEKKWRRKLKQISFFVEGIPSEGHRNILTTALGDLLK